MSKMPGPLTEADHSRIAEAVRAAEAKTAGEIYCVVARASDSYFLAAGFVVTLAIVLIAFALALLFDMYWISVGLPIFMAAQVLAIGCALLVLSLAPGIRIHFTPRRLRFRRAHDNAVKQFLARNVHMTAERTGVLIFVSLAEHYAAVIADAGINAKVNQSDWDDVVRGLTDAAAADRLADGFVAAIGKVGAHLARYFPPGPLNPNELDDHVVEI